MTAPKQPDRTGAPSRPGQVSTPSPAVLEGYAGRAGSPRALHDGTGIPAGSHLARASFVLEYQPPTKGRAVVREAHNLTPVAKAGIDGVVQAGVLPDDSDRYVAEVTFRRGDKHPGGRVVLHLLEVLDPSETPHV